MSLADFIWWTLAVFLVFAYLMVLWTILSDLFSDDSVSGWGKAAWVIGLILFPFIVALVYLIARGKGMQERKLAQVKQMQADQEAYIKRVSGEGKSPAEQIADAKALLDSGAISAEEFDTLKAKALA